MKVSIFGYGKDFSGSTKNLKYVNRVVDFREFARELGSWTKMTAWAPVVFKNNIRRKENVILPAEECIVVFDIDNPDYIGIDKILTLGEWLRGIVVNSKSGNYHLIVPIKLKKWNYQDLLNKLKRLLSGHKAFDTSVFEISRLFFITPVEKRHVLNFTGKQLVTDEELVKTLREVLSLKEVKETKNDLNISKFTSNRKTSAYHDYILYVISKVRKQTNFHVVFGENYIAFDGSNGWQTPLSCYYYFGKSFICLHTLKPIERLSKQFSLGDPIKFFRVIEREGRYFILDVPGLLYYTALSYGVDILPYNDWLRYRWLLKFKYVKLLFQYMKSGEEFRMAPEFGFTFSKAGTRSDVRLRTLKKELCNLGLLVTYGSAGKYMRFVKCDKRLFAWAVIKALKSINICPKYIIRSLVEASISLSLIIQLLLKRHIFPVHKLEYFIIMLCTDSPYWRYSVPFDPG